LTRAIEAPDISVSDHMPPRWFSTRYNFNNSVGMPLIRTRRLTPISLGLAVLATVISPSRSFQQKSTVNAGNPHTREDYEAGDKSREPNQRATDLLKAMEVLRGDWVADVGAGAG